MPKGLSRFLLLDIKTVRAITFLNNYLQPTTQSTCKYFSSLSIDVSTSLYLHQRPLPNATQATLFATMTSWAAGSQFCYRRASLLLLKVFPSTTISENQGWSRVQSECAMGVVFVNVAHLRSFRLVANHEVNTHLRFDWNWKCMSRQRSKRRKVVQR